MELNLKTLEGGIILDSLYNDMISIRVWEMKTDDWADGQITKEQAQQIIDHLKTEFNI